MSDIYLQITETPTVVTLSAPVVSGALSSTVTVANTVTVALDSNSLSALENVTVTVGAAITGTVTVSNFPATQPVSIASVTVGNTVTIAGTVTANPAGTQTIAGTVTANNTNLSSNMDEDDQPVLRTGVYAYDYGSDFQVGVAIIADTPAGPALNIGGTVTIGSALPAGTNRIGSVTASISGTVPVSISSVTVGNSVTIGSLPAIFVYQGGDPVDGDNAFPIYGTVTVGNSVTIASLPAISGTVTAMAGTNFSDEIYQGILAYANSEGGDGSVSLQVNIGTLPAISGTVTANTFARQGTAVTTSNFTSTTASTVLANYNATREVLTIFNEGAGNLFVCPGATCTTVQYQIRLSSGDYYEVPNHQTTITHSAVFATAGTARVTEVS